MVDLGVIISGIFSIVGGGSALFTFLYYRKQEKRLKNAEAVETEVATLRATVETLQKNQEFYEQRLSVLQSLIIEKDTYISTLSTDKHVLEVKHARNKSAINAAYGCELRENKADCPVLRCRTRNEEEYLKRIESKPIK